MSDSIDTSLRRQEEDWLDTLEGEIHKDLKIDASLPMQLFNYPSVLVKHLQQYPGSLTDSVTASAISGCISLTLRAWKRYVHKYQEEVTPDELLKQLSLVPRLADFLQAANLPDSFVQRFPFLARNELHDRISLADGASKEDYCDRFGINLTEPQHLLWLIIQPLHLTAFISLPTFPLTGRFDIGRQQSREMPAVHLSFHGNERRLVIANKTDVKACSRRQLIVCPLTPYLAYVKNCSDSIMVQFGTFTNSAQQSATLLLDDRGTPIPSSSTDLALAGHWLPPGKSILSKFPFTLYLPTIALGFNSADSPLPL